MLRGCIHAIRVALADTADTPQYLETVGRLGYQFRLGGPPRAGGRRMRAPWWADRVRWNGCASAGCGPGRARQCSLLSGEAGIGKTTVVDLFMASLAAQPEVWVGRGQCVETYGEGEPYLPMLEALGQLGQSPHREALRSVLQRYAPTWLGHLPALLGDSARERLQQQFSGVTPGRMLRELAEALEALARTTPLVLVLEDLHWSDVSTVNLLTYLAQRRDAARILLLGTYRPADVVVQAHPLRGMLQELRGRGVCDELALELLLPDEVEAYITARLGGEVTAELAALLYQQTEGNALFLVNLLEHLVEQGVVKQEGAQWTLRSPLRVVPSLPEAPQLLITKRFERLEPGGAARPGSGQCGGRRLCRRHGGGGAGRPRGRGRSPLCDARAAARLPGVRRPGRVARRDRQWVLPVSPCALSPGAGRAAGGAPADAGAPSHGGAPGAELWPADADDRHAAGLPFCAGARSPAGGAVSAPGGGGGRLDTNQWC